MRVLDKNYVTPSLRKHNLLKLNADGFMMTRTLAENYPYSFLYKAQLRGARDEWLAIVEQLEVGTIDPLNTLKYMISGLFNKAECFQEASNNLIKLSLKITERGASLDEITNVIYSHISNSSYAARLMEIAMHSLMQAAHETGAFGLSTLKPLSQMRSANKKHGNIGDIELLDDGEIIESWDAKYGKAYLRDEIDEAFEKIQNHHSVQVLGFVTTVDPIRNSEIQKKISDYSDLYAIKIQILTLEEWVGSIFDKVVKPGFTSEVNLALAWLTAYAESLAQKRRDAAPIDEPCIDWVNELIAILEKN